MKKPKIKSWGLLALATPILVTFAGLELAKAQSTPELLISVEFSGIRSVNWGKKRKSTGSVVE